MITDYAALFLEEYMPMPWAYLDRLIDGVCKTEIQANNQLIVRLTFKFYLFPKENLASEK